MATKIVISQVKNRIMKPDDKPSEGMCDAWHDDPSNWKWCIFYYNMMDKRIFSLKRVRALGWTVNFANPYSYLTLLGLIIILIVIGLNMH